MNTDNLPKTYKGYPVSELLDVLKELQGPGTKAPEEKILAMDDLVREYKLTPVHQVPKDAPGRLNFSTKKVNQHPEKPVEELEQMNVHELIAETHNTAKTIHPDSPQSRNNEVRMTGLPEEYMGYPISELLDVLKELQGPAGTTAPEEKISAMSKLVREYKLTIVYQAPNELKELDFSARTVNPHPALPAEETDEMDVHERIAEALLNIDKSDFNPGQDLLDQGKWITYNTPEYPDYTVKEHPNGIKELLDKKSSSIVKILLPRTSLTNS